MPTDEDESEPESEEEFELSEKEQRLLHEAYDTFATSGERWIHRRQGSPANCRTPFADAGNVRDVVDKFIDLPHSPNSTGPQTKETAPVEVPASNQVSSLPAMFPAQSAGKHG